MKLCERVLWFSGFFLLICLQAVLAEIIRVPEDYRSIQLAVDAARNGDAVEVAPGYYFETGIILDKNITLRSRVPYGAVINGGGDHLKNLLIVRAPVEIEGFILKNTGCGIIQRDSPDVIWTGRELAIFDCCYYAVSINDRENTVGSANLSNLIIMGCQQGVGTNDAGRISVRHAFIADCETAFAGTHHIRFSVDNIITWRCGTFKREGYVPHLPEANNQIETGEDIYDLDTLAGQYVISELLLKFRRDNPDVPLGRDYLTNGNSMILNKIGDIFNSLNNPEKAEFWYSRALETGRKLNLPGIVTEALHNLARIAEKTGRPREALGYYCRAASELEKERSGFSLLDERMYYLNNQSRIYEDMLNLLYSLWKSTGKEQFKKEAFQICEKTKARSFFDLLNQARLSSLKPVPENLLRRKKELVKEISMIQSELNSNGPAYAEKRKLYQKLKKTEKQHRSVLLQINEFLFPENFLLPQPYQAEYIQNHLSPETGIAEYFLGEKHAFAFLLSSKGMEFIRLPEPAHINNWAKNYSLFLTMPDTGEFEGFRGGARLFRTLLGCFGEDVFRCIKNLVVIPCGRLNTLPFETLIYDEDLEPERGYLINRFQISYSGSASTYVDLKNSYHPDNPQNILAVSCGSSREIMEKYPQNGYFRMDRVPELEYCEREINAVYSLLNKKGVHRLNGRSARESRIKTMALSDYKILHFATHGMVYDDNWHWSSLLLNPRDSGEDGLLRAHEIFDLSLDNDLVVLSACRTGQGKFVRGEGILGFIQAFHSTGAKAVVSSLWEINDLSTCEFMRHFYGFLSEGHSVSRSLTSAKKNMLRSRFRHPYYWAAFVAHGDSLRSVFE